MNGEVDVSGRALIVLSIRENPGGSENDGEPACRDGLPKPVFRQA